MDPDPEDIGPPVDAGLLQDVVTLPPGTVTIPGDNAACVKCALDQCATESRLCFVDSPSTAACYATGTTYPAPTDCCIDYRRCIDSCLSVDPTAGTAFYQCMLEGCDKDLPNGKSQFNTYRICVQAKCMGCAGDAGP